MILPYLTWAGMNAAAVAVGAVLVAYGAVSTHIVCFFGLGLTLFKGTFVRRSPSATQTRSDCARPAYCRIKVYRVNAYSYPDPFVRMVHELAGALGKPWNNHLGASTLQSVWCMVIQTKHAGKHL